MNDFDYHSTSIWYRVWLAVSILIVGFFALVGIAGLFSVFVAEEPLKLFLGVLIFTTFGAFLLLLWTTLYWMVSGHFPLSRSVRRVEDMDKRLLDHGIVVKSPKTWRK